MSKVQRGEFESRTPRHYFRCDAESLSGSLRPLPTICPSWSYSVGGFVCAGELPQLHHAPLEQFNAHRPHGRAKARPIGLRVEAQHVRRPAMDDPAHRLAVCSPGQGEADEGSPRVVQAAATKAEPVTVLMKTLEHMLDGSETDLELSRGESRREWFTHARDVGRAPG
jgi:hypothetical protein